MGIERQYLTPALQLVLFNLPYRTQIISQGNKGRRINVKKSDVQFFLCRAFTYRSGPISDAAELSLSGTLATMQGTGE
jgi:hypothetical protein